MEISGVLEGEVLKERQLPEKAKFNGLYHIKEAKGRAVGEDRVSSANPTDSLANRRHTRPQAIPKEFIGVFWSFPPVDKAR